MQHKYKNVKIPTLESGHNSYLKLELQKKLPGKRLYFLTDYFWSPESGNGSPTFIQEWGNQYNIQNLTDDMVYRINPNHLEEIKNHRAFLVSEMWLESGEIHVYWLYKKCIKAGIPTEQVILLGSSFDYKDISDRYAKEFNVNPINIMYYSFHERLTKRQFLLDKGQSTGAADSLRKLESLNDIHSIDIPNPLLLNDFKKRYIFLNNVNRPHRYALLTLLHQANLLEHGYVSFHRSRTGFVSSTSPRSDIPLFVSEYFDEPVRTMIKEGKTVDELLPLILDEIPKANKEGRPNMLSEAGLISNNSLDDFMLSSFIHVVGECFFGTKNTWGTDISGNECVFITEKILKPIRFKQPFIVLSYPNTLAALRRSGYKTFDGIIDESYDTELDDTKRIYKVFSEIKRICELDQSTLEEYRQKMIPIVEYNANVLFSKKDYIYDLRN